MPGGRSWSMGAPGSGRAGEGCASQCPRQSPLGKLSPSRIEVSFPRFFPSVVRFVGCHHSITPWEWPGAQGRSEVGGPKTAKGPDSPGLVVRPKDGAILTGEGEENQDGKGMGIHAAAGYGISCCRRVAPPTRKYPLASKGGLAFWATARSLCAQKAKTQGVKTTDCTPVISNLFRHRGFLHCMKSSRRVM